MIPGHTGISGNFLRGREVNGLVLTETEYPAGMVLPRHAHEQAYLTLVLEGEYVEAYGPQEEVCSVGMVRFLPAGHSHGDRYPNGARCLHVGIPAAVLARIQQHEMAFNVPGEVRGPALAYLSHKLYTEFRDGDDLAPLAIEGVIFEMLAESARARRPLREVPRWLKAARDILHVSFAEKVTLPRVAAQVGVHPVHLCREFRRHFRCTMGDYIRQLRVEHACKALERGEASLPEIAVACGFSDQSHFSTAFKRITGTTPAKFRNASNTRQRITAATGD